MAILLPALGVAFAGLCLWLTVRRVNRPMKPGVALRATVGLVGTVTLALVAYVSAYAYMVEGEWVEMTPDGPRVMEEYRSPAAWRIGDNYWRKVFAPVHWVDRQIRRDAWTPQ